MSQDPAANDVSDPAPGGDARGGVSGILVVNKPAGITSHDVVNRVRRIIGQKRVGHAGTLDPLATGVLVVCLGTATRVAEYAAGNDKTYCAEIVLGAATDTYDADGQVTSVRPVAVTLPALERALQGFVGDILQRPPAFSAIKLAGQPLYKAARAGETVNPQPRPVRITAIRVIQYQPPAVTIHVECGKGTYIRSLAHDLGLCLGCGAHLRSLVRLRSGHFDLDDAMTLEQVALAAQFGYLESLLWPADEVLLDTAALILGAERADRACRGAGFALTTGGAGIALSAGPESSSGTDLCRAYDLQGEFVALGVLDHQAGWWQPVKVLRPCY